MRKKSGHKIIFSLCRWFDGDNGAVGGPDLGSSGLGAYTGDAFEGKAGTRAAARASECVVGASGPGPARRDRPRRARTVVRMME